MEWGMGILTCESEVRVVKMVVGDPCGDPSEWDEDEEDVEDYM